jgi:hypothetical protein
MAQRGRPRKDSTIASKDASMSKTESAEMVELRAQMATLQKQIASIGASHDITTVAVLDTTEELRADSYITVVSLYPARLTLSTKPGGKGDLFNFQSFGEQKSMLYGDLVSIMESHSEGTDFLREGYYYIADERVIRRHGLNELYKRILSKEKIEQILSLKGSDVVPLFQSACKPQQLIICDMLVDMIARGKEVDKNLISAISQSADIDVLKKSEEFKKTLALLGQ